MAASDIDRAYWRRAILRGEATFFVGAGISAPSPSNLPLAAGLVESLIVPVLRPLDLPRSLERSMTRALVRLRPEVITDVLFEHLGVDSVRPILNALHGRPNAWHGFLAAALGTGCCIITTNFDTLIESAAKAIGARHQIVVGAAVEGKVKAEALLFKIHGSIGGENGGDPLESVALAVRQVGRGLSIEQTNLLRTLLEDRPLVVLGYSGRDDFDILPALSSLERSAPGLWVVHEPRAPIRTLAGASRRKSSARPAVECARAWPGALELFIGDTGEMLDLLRRGRSFGRLRDLPPRSAAPAVEPWLPPRDVATVALLYALVEARAFRQATRLFEQVRTRRMPARVLVAQAVVLEKEGIDLRAAAEVARQARRAARREPAEVRALVFDQSGVIARRRGLYALALRFYDRALKTSPRPEWLLIQIRSHRGVALEYLKRRGEALREQRRVAQYERRTGDLRGYAKSLNNIGIVQMNQRRWKQAMAAFEESCALKRQLGDARGIAQTLHNIGKLHFLRGDYESAEQAFLESLHIRQRRGRDLHGVAQSFVALAHVANAAGKLRDAETYARRALEAHMKYGDQRGVAQARGLMKTLAAQLSGQTA